MVSGAIRTQPGGRARLLLSPAAAEAFGGAIQGFYGPRGLFKPMSAAELVDLLPDLPATLDAFDMAADAGGVEAATGRSAWPALRPGSELRGGGGGGWLAEIAPVVHHTIGGLAIDADARVLTASGTAVSALFAAGEVAGGVHGAVRLGGCGLLEAAVFGSKAGKGLALLGKAPAVTGSRDNTARIWDTTRS